MTDVPLTGRRLCEARRGLAPDPQRKWFCLAYLPIPIRRLAQAKEQPEAPREAAVRPIYLFCAADS